jgi:hypothetical protein
MGTNLSPSPATFVGWITDTTSKDLVGVYNYTNNNEITFCTPGSYGVVIPNGVTSINAVCIAGGGGNGGGGGYLCYRNNIPVTGGTSIAIVVGSGGTSTGNAAASAGSDSIIFDSNGAPIVGTFSVVSTASGQMIFTGNASNVTIPGTSFSAILIGGGGSGSGHTTNQARGGGGGSLVYINNVTITPGSTYDITVGTGAPVTVAGTGGLGGSGLPGGDSSIASGGTVIATAGGGGGGSSNQTRNSTIGTNTAQNSVITYTAGISTLTSVGIMGTAWIGPGGAGGAMMTSPYTGGGGGGGGAGGYFDRGGAGAGGTTTGGGTTLAGGGAGGGGGGLQTTGFAGGGGGGGSGLLTTSVATAASGGTGTTTGGNPGAGSISGAGGITGQKGAGITTATPTTPQYGGNISNISFTGTIDGTTLITTSSVTLASGMVITGVGVTGYVTVVTGATGTSFTITNPYFVYVSNATLYGNYSAFGGGGGGSSTGTNPAVGTLLGGGGGSGAVRIIFPGSKTIPTATAYDVASITAGGTSLTVGTSYVIANLGNTTQFQWNTIAGTSGVTYAIGSSFTAATTGTGGSITNGTVFAAQISLRLPTGTSMTNLTAGTPVYFDKAISTIVALQIYYILSADTSSLTIQLCNSPNSTSALQLGTAQSYTNVTMYYSTVRAPGGNLSVGTLPAIGANGGYAGGPSSNGSYGGGGAGGYTAAGGTGSTTSPAASTGGGGGGGGTGTGGGGVNLYGSGINGGAGGFGGSYGYNAVGANGGLFGGGGGPNGLGAGGAVRITVNGPGYATSSFPSAALSVNTTIPQGLVAVTTTYVGTPSLPVGNSISTNSNISTGSLTLAKTPTGTGSALFTVTPTPPTPTRKTVSLPTEQAYIKSQPITPPKLSNYYLARVDNNSNLSLEKTLITSTTLADGLQISKTSDQNLSTNEDIINSIGWSTSR